MSARGVVPNRSLRADNPCPDADVHPSMRGESPTPLCASLSSYEFRAYKKGNGRIALHMRTTLMIQTTASFGAGYLKGATGLLVLPPTRPFDLELEITDSCDIPYDGETQALDLWATVLTDLRECTCCIGHMDLRVCFIAAGAPFEARVTNDVTVRRIRRRNE